MPTFSMAPKRTLDLTDLSGASEYLHALLCKLRASRFTLDAENAWPPVQEKA